MLGLLQSLREHFVAHVGLLDVHLQRGDALGRAGDLEVHVAVVVLGAGDVGQHRVLVALGHQAHGDSGHRGLERHPGVHHGERATANGRHRTGTIRFQNVADHADGVRERLVVGKHRRQSALSQHAVADLATARPTQEGDLSDAERREVVMHHESLLIVGIFKLLLPLALVAGGQRYGRQRLRLAAGEDGRAVRAGQLRDLAGDVADLIESSAVGAALVF